MRIYLSYRPEDGIGWPTVLTDELGRVFGRSNIVDLALEPANRASEQAAQCDVLIALIGPSWRGDSQQPLDGTLAAGKVDTDAGDRVVLQVSAALAKGLRVLPIRVGGTPMPEEGSLPAEMRHLTKLQSPELTSANRRLVIRDLCSSIDPDRPKRAKRRAIDIASSILITALLTGIAGLAWESSRPRLNDKLWLDLLYPIEFGAPASRYFDRPYSDLPLASATGVERWDSKRMVDHVPSWSKEFSCASRHDQATFIFRENRLSRVSFRFCNNTKPCQTRRFDLFAALAGTVPATNGPERHFESRGARIQVLAWYGPSLTVIDIVDRSGPWEGGEKWYAFLRSEVTKNQCEN